MSLIKITIDDREVQKLLKDLTSRVKDRRPLMRQIAGIMHDAVEENFEAEGRPKWKPSLRAIKQGGKTLQDTGNLATSISMRFDNDSAVVGTNKKYAAIHQFGGTIQTKNKKYLKFKVARRWVQKKEVTIPARPFLVWNKELKEDIKKLLSNYLNQSS